jgi:hypothetical protein
VIETASGPRLSLTVGKLSAGEYRVWLFNTIIDARALGVARPDHTLEVPLPPSFRRYRFVDVSRQPAGAGGAHPGLSVLRASTRGLRAGAVRVLAPPSGP